MSETPVVMKYDSEKIRLDLIPTSMIVEVGKVLTHGAKKYRDRGWEAGMDWNRAYGAALRHMTAFWAGEDLDPETGLPHLAHGLCELAFLLEYMTTHRELDNRPRYESAQKAVNQRCVPIPSMIDLSAKYAPQLIVRHDNGGNTI